MNFVAEGHAPALEKGQEDAWVGGLCGSKEGVTKASQGQCVCDGDATAIEAMVGNLLGFQIQA